MVEAKTLPRVDLPKPSGELIHSGVRLRELSPGNETDLQIAKALDLRSQEAINPFATNPEEAHTLMTDDELKGWMRDSDTSMMRVVEVDGRQIGFVYMYNDARKDDDFRRRAAKLREVQGAPSNHSVWEMNFWVDEGTEDSVVKSAVEGTLGEFVQKHPWERTLVMFADDGDMRESWAQTTEKPVEALKRWSEKRMNTAEEGLQDTRVLRQLGFVSAGRMEYSAGEGAKPDFMYAARIGSKSLQ